MSTYYVMYARIILWVKWYSCGKFTTVCAWIENGVFYGTGFFFWHSN